MIATHADDNNWWYRIESTFLFIASRGRGFFFVICYSIMFHINLFSVKLKYKYFFRRKFIVYSQRRPTINYEYIMLISISFTKQSEKLKNMENKHKRYSSLTEATILKQWSKQEAKIIVFVFLWKNKVKKKNVKTICFLTLNIKPFKCK